MTAQLRRARLIPFDEQGKNPQDAEGVDLDFNPETLTIRVANTLQDRPARRGRQRTQFVGSSSSTLTFDAVFDSTRPKNRPGETGGAASEEELDVRRRTEKLAKLLQVSDPKAKEPAPKRVRFSWGSILFDGVVDSYTEVLEYFSPEGVPLRSKVSLSLKEQKFEYQFNEGQSAARRTGGSGGGGGTGAGGPDDALAPLGVGLDKAGDVAKQNGLDSLLELDASLDLSFDASLSVDVGVSASVEARAEASLNLGMGVDLGFTAGASVGLSARAAVEVFGDAAVSAATGPVDLGSTARAGAAPSGAPRPTPWAPAGPAPGSRASALATLVQADRTVGMGPQRPSPTGGSFTATALPEPQRLPVGGASLSPLPIRGSPPRLSPRLGPPPPPSVFNRARARPDSITGDTSGRPRWEVLPPAPNEGPKEAGGACCSSCGQKVETPPVASPAPAKKAGPAPVTAARAPCGCGGGRKSW
jgi:hypothetical protein